MEADIMRQKEAAEAAKSEHELELVRLAATNRDGRTAERDDRTKTPKLPKPRGIKLDGHQNSVLSCLEEHSKCTQAYLRTQLKILWNYDDRLE